MKRKFLIALALVMTVTAGSCSKQEQSSEPQSEPAPVETPAPAAEEAAETGAVTVQEVEIPAQEQSPAAEEPETAALSESTGCTVEGGGYTIEVVSAAVVQDRSGNSMMSVKFIYKNSNSEPTNFYEIADPIVTQAGKELSSDGMILDIDDVTFYNFTVPVSNGQQITVNYCYPYVSDEPLEINMRILRDFNTKVLLASGSCTLYPA